MNSTPPRSARLAAPSSRREFLAKSAVVCSGLAGSSLLRAAPAEAVSTAMTSADQGAIIDLREFVRWITDELEPSVRLPGGAGHYAREPGQKVLELYGVADLACILYTINRLNPNEAERAQWAAAFQEFQKADTGWLVEKSPTHDPLHNTAFALGAMNLLDLAPLHPVTMAAAYSDPAAFLATLDWRDKVYTESHKGAGVGAIFALTPALRSSQWFDRYFAACESHFDPHNGMMGTNKPANGDSDQIGGTFHYGFLYENFNRHMPYPEQRIDSVIRLQLPDGYWMASNHLWMTLDAIYLMTRSLRYCAHRYEDVRAVVRRVMGILVREVYSPAGRQKTFTGHLAVHLVTAAISIAAEAQKFLGAAEVVTDEPLRLVLDRRPFI